MPTRLRSRFPRSSGPRHRSSWAFGPETAGSGGPQALAGTAAQLAGTVSSVGQDSITLIRTRGELLLYLTTATAQGDGFHGAFGLAKVSSAALLAGQPSVPSPLTEDTWDGWYYHRYFSIIAAGPIAVATAAQEALQNAATTAALRIEVDSKAMRKMSIDEGTYASIDVIEHGTATMEWLFNCRELIKLMA